MNEQTSTTAALPLPTIRRYPNYLRCIKEMIGAVVAERLGFDPVLARKDLAMAGVPGKPRRGYPALALQDAINHALGWDSTTDAVLVGVGSLGNALLGYTGFEEQNLSIVAAFDAKVGVIGFTFHGVKVRPMEDLPRLVKRLGIKLGILTVPNAAAQTCQLDVPAGVTVQNVDLAQSLAVLSHSITNAQ